MGAVLTEAGPLHPQLGAGARPHPPRPVAVRDGGDGGGGGVLQVLVLGDSGQVLWEVLIHWTGNNER